MHATLDRFWLHCLCRSLCYCVSYKHLSGKVFRLGNWIFQHIGYYTGQRRILFMLGMSLLGAGLLYIYVFVYGRSPIQGIKVSVVDLSAQEYKISSIFLNLVFVCHYTRQSSGSRKAAVKHLSGSLQEVIRQSSGSRQAVVRQSSYFLTTFSIFSPKIYINIWKNHNRYCNNLRLTILLPLVFWFTAW